MLEGFRRYFTRLEGLSCGELDRSAEKLVVREKENGAKLIAHIAEMSRRKAALELGYKNLFDYCLRRLRLSEGSIPLRMQVANVARRFPQLLVALAENRISLTVAGFLASRIDEGNVDELLAECEGMTKRQAEERLIALRPKPVFQPSIRRQPARPPAQPTSPIEPTPSPPYEAPPPPPTSKPIVEPARPEVFNFRFAADRSFKDKFERLAEVLGVENAHGRMAEIFEQALDDALDKKDPQKKLERRRARERKQNASKPKSSPDEISQNEPADSRYIPSEVRERVLERADHRCDYHAEDGTRCPSRTGLQIEHVRPFGIYRSHDERFLRAYCPPHNRFAAERAYGRAFIERKIDEKRSHRARAP